MSGSYLASREIETELLTTILYSMPAASVDKFHEKSVCNKIEGVLLRLFKFSTSKPYSRRGNSSIFTKDAVCRSVKPPLG